MMARTDPLTFNLFHTKRAFRPEKLFLVSRTVNRTKTFFVCSALYEMRSIQSFESLNYRKLVYIGLFLSFTLK